MLEFLSSILVTLQELYTSSDLFPPPTFAYVFPLLRFIILREGRMGALKDRVVTELVMSAADILLAHCVIGGSSIVFRRGMVRCLLEMLGRYPRLRVAARQGLLTLSIAVGDAENESDDEEDEDDHKIVDTSKSSDLEGIVRELLNGLIDSEAAVREACLLSLAHLPAPADPEGEFAARIWVARFDPEETIRTEAETLWELWIDSEMIAETGIQNIMDLTGEWGGSCSSGRFLHAISHI